jgi:hypothetical protein
MFQVLLILEKKSRRASIEILYVLVLGKHNARTSSSIYLNYTGFRGKDLSS